MTTFDRGLMPSFSGAAEWLNSEPLSPAGLHGQVVVVDFWTLTCINWLRTEPYVRAWAEGYQADGLVVVGVHTPEFSFEHDVELVRQATYDRSISYPIVVDNEYVIWRAFGNHYWPALYFFDADGSLRDQYFGEGRYEESERTIQRLLGVERPLVQPARRDVEAEADWDELRTPETYLGYARGSDFASPGGPVIDQRHAYQLPDRLGANQWALAGEWSIGPEAVTVHQPGGTLAVRFHARDCHLVLSTRSPRPVPIRVLLDGEPPGASHGADIDQQGHGQLRAGRLYQLLRQDGEIRDRTAEVTFSEPGAEAYVATFG